MVKLMRRNDSTRTGLVAGLVLAVVAAGPSAGAQSTQPAAESGRVPFYWLRVTVDRVNLRSRADANSRIVARATRDQVLKAVGREYGWYRIIPPPGVYSIVSADYIEPVGNDRGVVRVVTTLRVRVGSDIQPRDPLLSEVQVRLPRDAEVHILGRLGDRWLKIAPPKDVYVYVFGDYVERIDEAEARRLMSRGPRPASRPATGFTTPTVHSPTAAATQPVASRPAQPAVNTPPTMPTSRPAVARTPAPRIPAKPIPPAPAQVPASASVPKPAPPALVVVRGVLRPCFDLPAGPFGMRYEVRDPVGGRILAYVEFPPKIGFPAPRSVGRYVAVAGQWQKPSGVGVRVLRATRASVIALHPPAGGTRPTP